MKRRRTRRAFTRAAHAARESFLTAIGQRFKDIRIAKQFARDRLAKGVPPAEVLARVAEACRVHYAILEPSEGDSMTDVVLSAVAAVIDEWRERGVAPRDRLDEWIHRTVASNRAFVREKGFILRDPSRTLNA